MAKFSAIDYILRILVAILAIFSEAKVLFHAVSFLILVDQVSGVAKALTEKGFDWAVFNRVYKKVLLYMLVMMATFVFEKFIIESSSIFFTKAMSGIIGFQELVSAYNNVTIALGKGFFKRTIDKFKHYEDQENIK